MPTIQITDGIVAAHDKYLDTNVGAMPPEEIRKAFQKHWGGLEKARIVAVDPNQGNAMRGQERAVNKLEFSRDEKSVSSSAPSINGHPIDIDIAIEIACKIIIGHARERVHGWDDDRRETTRTVDYVIYFHKAPPPGASRQSPKVPIRISIESLHDEHVEVFDFNQGDHEDPRYTFLTETIQMQRDIHTYLIGEVTKVNGDTIKMLSFQTNQLHERLIKRDEMATQHIQPLVNLLYYMGQITGGAWQAAQQAMQTQFDIESERIAQKSRDQRWMMAMSKLSPSVNKLIDGFQKFVMKKMYDKEGIDDDGDTSETPLVNAGKPGESERIPNGMRHDDDQPIASGLHYFLDSVRPEQWSKFEKSFDPIERERIFAIFRSRTDQAALHGWKEISDDQEMLGKLVTFGAQLDEDQSTHFQALMGAIIQMDSGAEAEVDTQQKG